MEVGLGVCYPRTMIVESSCLWAAAEGRISAKTRQSRALRRQNWWSDNVNISRRTWDLRPLCVPIPGCNCSRSFRKNLQLHLAEFNGMTL